VSDSFADLRLTEALELARSGLASDVHLAVGRPPMLRVDGSIQATVAAELSCAELERIVDNAFGPADRAAFDRVGDRTVAIHAPGVGRARLHASRTHKGFAVSIRLLPQEVPTLESLNLPAAIDTFTQLSRGLLIFAGPTGSGKTTSLAAVVSKIARTSARHVISIEDPIEYLHRCERSIVTQREVGRDVHSFEEAVIGALRCDPDVIVIGEMRTSATIRAALIAAETGHLVLSTLHTSDAASTVARMVDCFEPQHRADVRSQLAGVVAGIVCQRLVNRISGGRRVAAEVLIANDAVRHLIREAKGHQLAGVIQTHRALGMQTLAASVESLVALGEVAPQAVNL
jgi:twitching motility protein PilT